MFRNISRATEYKIAAVIIILLTTGLMMILPLQIEKSKVRQVKTELREIGIMIEAWFVDHSHYPYTDEFYKTGEHNLGRGLYGSFDGDYEERVKSAFIPPARGSWNRFKNFAALTTPTAYLPEVPRDFFSPDGNLPYRYGVGPLSYPWILASNGPDGDEDLDVNQFCLHTSRHSSKSYHDYDSVYYGYEKPLVEYMYDPTNGMKSNGDIIRIMQ